MSLRDLIGDMKTDHLMEELGEVLITLKNLGLNKPRPWGEFFEVFKPLSAWTREKVEQRVTANFLNYRTNYLYILCGCTVWFMIMSPMTLFMVILACCLFFFFLSWKEPIDLGFKILSNDEKNIAGGICSMFLLLITGSLFQLLWGISMAVLLCSLHMTFRPRSIQSKFNQFSEEMKMNDLDIEGSSSVNKGGMSSTTEGIHSKSKIDNSIPTKSATEGYSVLQKKKDFSVGMSARTGFHSNGIQPHAE